MDCFRLILRELELCKICGKLVVMCLVKVMGHCEVCLHFLTYYHTCLMNSLWSFDLPEL